MDVLGMIYRVQQVRLRIFRHKAEWQFTGEQRELYKIALSEEDIFWKRFLDWREFWDECDPCAEVINAAADAYAAWYKLWLKVIESGVLRAYENPEAVAHHARMMAHDLWVAALPEYEEYGDREKSDARF